MGFKLLAQCRTNGLLTGELLGKRLADKHRRCVTECPCCRQLAPETLDHFFWSCAAWNGPRARLLAGLASTLSAAAHATFSALSDSDKTTVLLGGVTQTGFTFADWLDASAPDKRPVYFHVVCFLNSIQSARLPSSMTSCMLQAEALVKESMASQCFNLLRTSLWHPLIMFKVFLFLHMIALFALCLLSLLSACSLCSLLAVFALCLLSLAALCLLSVLPSACSLFLCSLSALSFFALSLLSLSTLSLGYPASMSG